MSGNTQESIPDAPAQKSVTDWLMQVISRNETSESHGHDPGKNGNGSGLNGHAPGRNGHVLGPEEAHADTVFGKIENGNGSISVVDPPSQLANLQSSAADVTADDLCGPPAFGPVPRSFLDQISPDDLCWVPKAEPVLAAEPEFVKPAVEEPPFVSVQPQSVSPQVAAAVDEPPFVYVEPQPAPTPVTAAVDESQPVYSEPQAPAASVTAAEEPQPVAEIQAAVLAAPVVDASPVVTYPERQVAAFEPAPTAAEISAAEQLAQPEPPVTIAPRRRVTDVFDVFNIDEPTAAIAEVPASVQPEPPSMPTLMPAEVSVPAAAVQMPVAANPEPEIIPHPEPEILPRIEPVQIEPAPRAAADVFAVAETVVDLPPAAAPVLEVHANPEPATRVEAHAEVLAPAPLEAPVVAAAVHPTLEMPAIEAAPSMATEALAKAEVAVPEMPAIASAESAPAPEPQMQAEVLAPAPTPTATASAEISGGLAKIEREAPAKRARRGKRERAVTVADICRDWVLQEMMDREGPGIIGGAEPEEELEDSPEGEESEESASARGGVWAEGERKEMTEGTSESALALNDDASEIDGDPRNSAVRTLLHMGSMLPWLARESPAADSRNKQSIALTQEVRQEVAGMRLVQHEIRSTVHDHSLQLKRVEDQLTRVRETLVDDADETAELVTSVKSTTRTVQVVGISVCALLGFVLVMVMLLFLRAK
ncbi:MAG TPA: hypothetical protein VFW25_00450 [Silvibacterium sp.]|nr:hypothetical protein [Silvibacterium sp.]